MKIKIDMYSDFQCPFCYIGKSILDKVKGDFDTDFTFKGYEIHSDAPEEGIDAEKYFGKGHLDANRIVQYGAQFGVDIKMKKLVINSNKALRLAEYAKKVGKGDQYNDIMYKAMFRDTLNIGTLEVLKDLAAQAGMSGEEVDTVLADPQYRQTLDDNLAFCRANNITGVPCFIINDKYMINGAQSPEVFTKLFNQIEKGEKA